MSQARRPTRFPVSVLAALLSVAGATATPARATQAPTQPDPSARPKFDVVSVRPCEPGAAAPGRVIVDL